MMNFKQFTEAISENLKKVYPDKKIQIFSVLKNNNTKLTGINIMSNETNICPVIYLDDYYLELTKGMSLDEALKDIVAIYEKYKVEKPIDISDFLDYEKVKERIIYRLINYEKNLDLLKDIPYIRFLDLAIVFYYVFPLEVDGAATALIHNSHSVKWKKSAQDLFAVAEYNTPKILECEYKSMEEVLERILKTEICEVSNPLEMYVLSNASGILGASAMIYKDVLKNISRKMQSDLYILPSSIHEVIIISANLIEGMEELELLNMVEEVNSTQLSYNEILSDNLYYFSREDNTIFLVLGAPQSGFNSANIENIIADRD